MYRDAIILAQDDYPKKGAHFESKQQIEEYCLTNVLDSEL